MRGAERPNVYGSGRRRELFSSGAQRALGKARRFAPPGSFNFCALVLLTFGPPGLKARATEDQQASLLLEV